MPVFENRKPGFIARKIYVMRLPFCVLRRAESFDVRVQFPAHFVQNFSCDGRIDADD